MYAETFKCQPHEVGNIPLVWWKRWRIYEQAKESRAAYIHSKRVENWVTDLSEAERDAMNWASGDNG